MAEQQMGGRYAWSSSIGNVYHDSVAHGYIFWMQVKNLKLPLAAPTLERKQSLKI